MRPTQEARNVTNCGSKVAAENLLVKIAVKSLSFIELDKPCSDDGEQLQQDCSKKCLHTSQQSVCTGRLITDNPFGMIYQIEKGKKVISSVS